MVVGKRLRRFRRFMEFSDTGESLQQVAERLRGPYRVDQDPDTIPRPSYIQIKDESGKIRCVPYPEEYLEDG